MSFLLTCPNCGKRPVGEFSYRGEYRSRPEHSAEFKEWVKYVFMRNNAAEKQVEWWYHVSGCKRWFLVKRDSRNNLDHSSHWFGTGD